MTESADLKKSLEEILAELDEDSINNMSEEQLTEYRKLMNPYGRVIAGSDKILSFSYTNLREKYIEKLMMTSMIAFLNRMCDEYHVPEGLPVVPVYDYAKNPDSLDESVKDWKRTPLLEKQIEENKAWMQKRVIIKEFLENAFQYNPDTHVRSSYKPSVKDLSREMIDTPAANLAVSELKHRDKVFREQMIEFDRVQNLIKMNEGELKPELQQLVCKKLVTPEYHYGTVEFEKWSKEDLNLLNTAYNMIPPVDIFGNFRTYYNINYDKLREAVQHLYVDKPDFDIAICPHSWHDDDEDADKYIQKHRGEVITDVIKAHSGKWNLLASFAKVREGTKFYNDDTIILENIAKQIEADSKLGAELMKNRVKKMKKKNIEQDGPDDEIFKNWKKENATLKDMKGITNEDDEDDIPEDALEVPVFRLNNGKVEQTKFYTKVVEPTNPEELSKAPSQVMPPQ